MLDVAEVMRVLDKIDVKYGLMARIQYGGGLRLMELVRLRVKDVDPSPLRYAVASGGPWDHHRAQWQGRQGLSSFPTTICG